MINQAPEQGKEMLSMIKQAIEQAYPVKEPKEQRGQTFRRSKIIKWIKLETKITEGLMQADASESFIQARNDMLERLIREFGIELHELND